jgi:speckle-type POZ protein
MLESEMEEARTNEAKIDDIDGVVVMEMIRFMYTGEVQNMKDHVKELLYAAEKYELMELKKKCVESMSVYLNMKNVYETLTLADRFNADILLDNCVGLLKQ